MKQLRLKEGRIASISRKHPWIFSGALIDTKQVNPGEIVDVVDPQGNFVARGYFESGSIAVRILTFDSFQNIDAQFWVDKLAEARNVRAALQLIQPVEAYRLIYGEGDGIPGLIVDIYDNVAVIQAHTHTMHLLRNELATALKAVYREQLTAIYYKPTDAVTSDQRLLDELLFGSIDSVEKVIATENGLKFAPDILKGQKTGFFLDQRTSRERVGLLSKGRRVLNMFCYTGGFSLYALRGGAERVVSIDSSSKAIDLLEGNMRLNFSDELVRHEAVVQDAFKYLYDMDFGVYDLIVLDPPAFAKRRSVLKNALQGYRKLNTEAMRKIAPGGLLFTFSCSQVVSVDDFRQTLFTSALYAGRDVRILQQFGQFGDHPTSIFHPEGEYLKGFLLYVS